MRQVGVVAACLAVLGLSSAAVAAEFQLKEVPASQGLPTRGLAPHTIYFTDHKDDPLAEGDARLIRFDAWLKERPAQARVLDLYPGYEEPTVEVSVHGTRKPRQERLYMYVVEARFRIAEAPEALDLGRYATLDFLRRIDPAITHESIGQDQVVPLKDPHFAFNARPDRKWCDPHPHSLCIRSHYRFEGKLPMGIRLANKLQDGGKKIPEFLDFQSELRLLDPAEVDAAALAKLTGIDAPIVGVLEQSTFYVNQIMRFGKFVAVLQRDPTDASATTATALMALAVKADVIERKREFESVPVLRNLVPSQVLLGNSSFNTGASISAGLPRYTRHTIEAVAALLEEGR